MKPSGLSAFRSTAPRLLTLLQWLWKGSKGNRRPLLINCLLGMFHVLVGLLFIWCSKRVMDTATGQLESSLWIESLYACLLFLLQILISAGETWITNRTQVNVANRMRQNLFRHILQSRWNALQNLHTGDIINRIEQDTQQVVTLLTSTIPTLLVSGFQLLAAFLLFCHLDARIAWTIAAIAPLCLLLSKFYIQRMRRYTRVIRQSDSKIQSVIQESIQHRTVIKTLEEHPRHLKILQGLQQILFGQVDRRTRFSILSRTVLAIGFAGGYLTAFIWGAYQLSLQLITFGTMTAFLQLVGQIQSPAYSLSRLIPGIIHTLTSAERLIELEKLPTEEQGHPILITQIPSVHLHQVSFHYQDNRGQKEIFRQLNLTFPAGSTTAILGETGAGKTTLIRLLLALIHPDEGDLTLSDGKVSYPVSPQTRINFVYVPQGNTLFSGTIYDNLLMGNPAATEEEMRRVLDLAEAGFVWDLAQGLHTSLAENGGGLSEGQAQRISIARSLLRPGNILLFDEATSALDTETEKRLLDNLQQHYSHKTMIFITHHPALAALCDQVFKI